MLSLHISCYGFYRVQFFLLLLSVSSLYRHIFSPYRMLHIYGEYSNNLTAKMNARDDKYIIDAVLINDVPSGIHNKNLKVRFEQSKRVCFTLKISDIIAENSDELNLYDAPICFFAGILHCPGHSTFSNDVAISLSL